MNNQYVAVRYRNGGEYTGRTYTYIAGIPLIVGDEVIAPTAKGDNRAIVVDDHVPESRIDERIMPLLKSITEKYMPPEPQQPQPEPNRILSADEI